ncbi:MAG: MFS transporter [Lacisediminihabitans sp.]
MSQKVSDSSAAVPPGREAPEAPPSSLAPTVILDKAAKSRLLGSLMGGYLFLFATYAGIVAIILPVQVSLIDATHKVENLAIVTAISAVATLFAQPIVGALSDRTRARLGRRSPWIIFGGIGGGVITIAMQFAPTIFWIAVFWVAAQVLLNAYQGPISATIADRIEESGRATASAFTGVGTSIGATLGIVLAGRLLANLGIAYTLFGAAVIIASVLFVVLNPDHTRPPALDSTWSWGAFARGFWISPRKHPDFAWAFGGRFFMVLGYQGVQNYQFYILTDYLHLDPGHAGAIAGTLAICSLITVVLGTLAFGRISDKLHRRKVFVFGASIVMGLGVLIPVLFPTVPAMIVSSLVVGLGYGAYSAVDFALMVDVLPSQGSIGKDLGVLNVASNVPQAITPLLAAGLLWIFAGNYASIYIFAAVAVVISSLLVFPIKKVR